MADAPKRKPAKRGPTKAAALKALGLTQEDLDALKRLREPDQSEPKVHEAQATARLVRRDDPQAELEERPAPQPEPTNLPKTQEEPTWYMRNLRHVEVSFRLSRQDDMSKSNNRTSLKPRGSRGDMAKLEPGDLKDSQLQTQVAYGLVEVIPEGEALEAMRKQYNNSTQEIPAHIAMLRNPKGEEYAQADPVKFATDEEAYGVKVADLDPKLMQGGLSDSEIKRGGGFAQQDLVGPVQNPSPGRIISDGFMAEAQQGLGNQAGDNAKAAEVDALARSKTFEGPGAGLGEVTVKVAPVQRS